MIAPSFGDIFFTNSLKNGFLPVVLTEQEVDGLFYDAASFPGFKLVIDLEGPYPAILIGTGVIDTEPGSVKGLHLVVRDVAAARDVAQAAKSLREFAKGIAIVGADDTKLADALGLRVRTAPIGRMQRPPLDGPVDLRA